MKTVIKRTAANENSHQKSCSRSLVQYAAANEHENKGLQHWNTTRAKWLMKGQFTHYNTGLLIEALNPPSLNSFTFGKCFLCGLWVFSFKSAERNYFHLQRKN
jgi:hypothetical protein